MKVINVIKAHLWKTNETLYCLVVDCSSIELARMEHSIPRLRVSEQGGVKIDGIWHDTSRLIVGITTPSGEHFEVFAALNIGEWEVNGSISIYTSELRSHPMLEHSLYHSEIKLLRYEI